MEKADCRARDLGAASSVIGRTRRKWPGVWTRLIGLAGMLVAITVLPLAAQEPEQPEEPDPVPIAVGAIGAMPNSYPLATYYSAFAPYHDGQYAQAIQQLQTSQQLTRKVPGPWLDSICHHAMLGECYYQLGRLKEALSEYTTALQIGLAYPNWLDRVQFAELVSPAGAGQYVKTTWGQSRRNPTLGYFPVATAYMEGNVDNTQAVTRGGVVQAPQYLSVNPYEIVRGTCLALRRRAELMGAIGESDPLNQQLVEFYLQANRNGWARFLIDVPLAFAYRAARKSPQAQAVLERSITCNDFDHPLTGLVLLELGQLAREAGNHNAAADFFEEATFAAAQYDDADTIDTGFQELLGLERLLNNQRDLPSIPRAADWAGVRDLRKLRVMLLLAAAEQEANAGQSDVASEIFDQADQLVARRDLRNSRGGARLLWVQALLNYQANNLADGLAAANSAIAWQQHGSPRQFQLQLLEQAAGNEALSARNALAIYSKLLREPDGAEWIRDPLDALTAWSTPQATAFEQWFLLAWDRQRAEERSLLLEIADRARRHKFLSSLELGGRPQALAWLQAAVPEQLDPELKLQRQDLLLRYPEYERARQQASPLRAEFVRLSAASETLRRPAHDDLLDRLMEQVGVEQRALHELALRREPAGIVFPPVRTTADVQRALPEKQAVLAFFVAGQQTFGFLIARDKYHVWKIGAQEKLDRNVAALLKSWHHVNSHRPLTAADATDIRWKKQASTLLSALTAGSETDFPASLTLDELTIVPDGTLWYLPFEALQIGSAKKPEALITRLRLRYAPTVALAVDRIKAAPPAAQTVALLGKLTPRDDDASMAELLTQLQRVAPGTVGWRRPISHAAAVAATVSDRLLVFDTLPLDGRNPLEWSPLGFNHGDTETTLADWLKLPWPVPREVLLPGFHTAAEISLQHDEESSAPDGSELFLSTMALVGAGARTVVFTRWRTGGGTVPDEIREFVQESPFVSPSEAWQRSLLLCMRDQLDPSRETRLNWKSRQQAPKASHPFFWASTLLIDCGIPADQAPERELLGADAAKAAKKP